MSTPSPEDSLAGLGQWWGGRPRATQCYRSDRSLQLCALNNPPMTEVREHARVAYSFSRCCRAFPNRVSFHSGISWLSHTSPTCPLLRCSPTASFLGIYFLWQFPKRLPPLIPREGRTDPCLVSTIPLPKNHLLCLVQHLLNFPPEAAAFPL